jgi:hypothetical protein
MDKILAVIEWLKSPAGAALFAGLFALSEAIGAIPSVKASGVFQAVSNALKFVKEKLLPQPEAK